MSPRPYRSDRKYYALGIIVAAAFAFAYWPLVLAGAVAYLLILVLRSSK